MCVTCIGYYGVFFMDKIKQEIALKENQVQILQDKIKDYEKLEMLSKQLQSVLGH